MGKLLDVDGLLISIAHVGVHLGEDDINHLGEGGFRCVFVDLARARDVDRVLRLECFEQGALVHF